MSDPAQELLIAMCVSTFLVVLTVIIHYEVLRGLWHWVPRMQVPHRMRLLAVIFGAFFAHTVEVWCYALAFYLIDIVRPGTSFGGDIGGGFLGHLYFSAVSYTSLGLGDVYPLGMVRLITGVEALNGLLLIAWTASFTYLSMEKFWQNRR